MSKQYSLIAGPTQRLAEWVREIQSQDAPPFEIARQLVRRLGVHVGPEGSAEVGFWAPEINEQNVPLDAVYLELYDAIDPVDLRADSQTVRFARSRVPLQTEGDYLWGVVEGMTPGTRDQLGTLYRVVYRVMGGDYKVIIDPLAYSIPYGLSAPAEFYDIGAMQAARADQAYFRERLDTQPDREGVPTVQAPVNILQIHPGTASPEGTLAGLTRIYARIAEKLRSGKSLTPAEQHYVGYDSIQLMPIEPVIEYEVGPGFWRVEDIDPATGQVRVSLHRPDMTNWGYDVLIGASSAVNPVILESGRPDELVDLIATLHNFPDQPIKVLLDVVYGHIDNQSLPLMNTHWFAGANMYGQNLDYLHPMVRASLLEMQRRKHNFGIDGVRVDGAQDFKNWDPETGVMWHDDAYLQQMSDVTQEVAGVQYRPWMIFEDGRPWPRDDWELASSYREVTKQQPDIWQWGPLTFAHNTPFLFTFWISKWWRIREIAHLGGGRWITGVSNHDTLRRGTQVDPQARINTYLGDSLPEIFINAYDNPASTLFTYAFMPGLPMDFINASMHAPWSFIRNTDDRWGVKVMSEEANLLDWVMTGERFVQGDVFTRLKAQGFTELGRLKRFVRVLDAAVRSTQYDLEAMCDMMNSLEPPLIVHDLTPQRLKEIARAWMDDMHDYCNVSRYTENVDPRLARFNLMVRDFRRERRWLMDNLGEGDHFDYLYPTEGSVIFYGMRSAPDGGESLLFAANMEGEPREIIPASLPVPGLPSEGWSLALATPGLDADFNLPVVLHNSQAVVFRRG